MGRPGTLDGSGSSDDDGEIVSYAWALDGGPTFSTDAVTSYTCGTSGKFDVTLTVTDDDGASASATTSLDCVANVAPVADPGGPYQALVGETVLLDGRASEDADGEVVDWDWSITPVDGGTPTELTGETATFTCTAVEEYVVLLTVQDDDGAGDQDATTLACLSANTDPTVSFSQALYVGTIGDGVPVSASASDPDPGDGITAIDFDLDDDGSYETIGTVIDGSAQATFTCSIAGTFDIGVQATDQNSGRGLAAAQVRCDEPAAPSSDVSVSFPGPTSGGLRDRIGTVAEPATR